MNPTLARKATGGSNASARTAGVAAGSVWETRMLNDQVMGGIKLYADGDAEETRREEEEDVGVSGEDGEALERPASSGGEASERRRRRSWRPPDAEGRMLSDILRGAPVPTEGDASAAEKESDTPRRKTWVVEEIKQVDRVQEVPSHPPAERKPSVLPEAATEYPSARHAAPEIVLKSAAKVELEKETDCFYDSVSDVKKDRIQSIVDLLMWVDVSRSALAFAVGAFLLYCSSYAKELDFSLISGVSFIGLLNLAGVFIYKSIIDREVDRDQSDQKWWIGEEEAVRFTRMALPYMNKLLGKLRTWFSGDPATTMKLAVMLFILCRYGGQITVWTMAKMAFFGAFTIPRLCLSPSAAMSPFGKAWLDRVRNVWDSCTHKKAAFATLFLILWNLSSLAVRVWAGFMLVVVLRYYQQQQQQQPQPRTMAKPNLDSKAAANKKQKLAQQRLPSKVAVPPPLAEATASGQHRLRRHGPSLPSSFRLVETASAKVTRKRI